MAPPMGGAQLVRSFSGLLRSPALTNLQETVLVLYQDQIKEYELWKSDGTETGTMLLKVIPSDSETILKANPHGNSLMFYPLNARALFVVRNKQNVDQHGLRMIATTETILLL